MNEPNQPPVALVTGASRGIGAAIARALVRRGVRVALGYHRSEQQATELAASLTGEGGIVELAQGDVAEPAQAKKIVRAIKKQWGRLDILINNAGVVAEELFFLSNLERFWDLQRINLGGTINCCRAAIPMLSRHKNGCIINMSSIAAQHGTTGLSAYACSKAAIEALTKVLARELAAVGVRVNAVAPGLVATEMTDNLRDPARHQASLQMQPVSRMGTPEEVASLVTYLALDAPAYLTGEIVRIDGGAAIA